MQTIGLFDSLGREWKENIDPAERRGMHQNLGVGNRIYKNSMYQNQAIGVESLKNSVWVFPYLAFIYLTILNTTYLTIPSPIFRMCN